MTLINQRGNLAEIVVKELISRIDAGIYRPGEKLPSSQQLCDEFGVSRTVVREAIGSLKLGGRVSSRQGSGVFVVQQEGKSEFRIDKIDSIRTAMQTLELRYAVELQTAALAASRRTPEDLADIARAYASLENVASGDADKQAQADLDFHLAIARATHNPRFTEFLEAIIEEIIFDLRIKHVHYLDRTRGHVKRTSKEHAAIVAAITQGDPTAARKAMGRHLEEGLDRYQRLLSA